MPSERIMLHSSELRELLVLRMCADPMPTNINQDLLDDFLDRASAELGFTNWLDAYHKLP